MDRKKDMSSSPRRTSRRLAVTEMDRVAAAGSYVSGTSALGF